MSPIDASVPQRTPVDADEVLSLLAELGAPRRLVHHHELVLEAARELVAGLEHFAACFDANELLMGAALHDAGKILHPSELSGTGCRHERDGDALLRSHGLGTLARFCVTHAQWRGDHIGIEDLLVALADTLWKGRRSIDLEQCVVTRLSRASAEDYWSVFIQLDDVFERVAAQGPRRLLESEACLPEVLPP